MARGIDRELVDEVWQALTSYPPGRIASEAVDFSAGQPHVAAFAYAVTRDQEPGVQQAALGLSFLVFKVLERSLGRPFPTVAAPRLDAACDRTRAWLADGMDGDPARVVRGALDPVHPTLVSYVLSVFYGESLRECDERVQASLLLLLQTLVDAVDLGAVEG